MVHLDEENSSEKEINDWKLKLRNEHTFPIASREGCEEQITTSQKWVTVGENRVGEDELG